MVTGGAVRLTGSGLGCPTWPRCTDDSYVTTAAMGIHGVIEFGNRMLTFVVGLHRRWPAWWRRCCSGPRRPRRCCCRRRWSSLGIPAQGVVGGITVLTDLNPWVVGLHFLLSMALIAAAYALWRRTARGRPAVARCPPRCARSARVTPCVAAAVLVVGTGGDRQRPARRRRERPARTGLDPQAMSQLHADLVFLLIGLSVALWFALRAVGAPRGCPRRGVLVVVELAQGLIGFVQYFTGLPVLAGRRAHARRLPGLAGRPRDAVGHPGPGPPRRQRPGRRRARPRPRRRAPAPRAPAPAPAPRPPPPRPAAPAPAPARASGRRCRRP